MGLHASMGINDLLGHPLPGSAYFIQIQERHDNVVDHVHSFREYFEVGLVFSADDPSIGSVETSNWSFRVIMCLQLDPRHQNGTLWTESD